MELVVVLRASEDQELIAQSRRLGLTGTDIYKREVTTQRDYLHRFTARRIVIALFHNPFCSTKRYVFMYCGHTYVHRYTHTCTHVHTCTHAEHTSPHSHRHTNTGEFISMHIQMYVHIYNTHTYLSQTVLPRRW